MNKDANNQGNFIKWQDYQKLLEKIQQFNNSASYSSQDKSDYLETYHNILEMRKKAFPLLLREGEAYLFDTPPVNCYLLPPLDGVAERWLLVFFVNEVNQSQVQIMTWQCGDKHPASVKPLAGQAPVDIIYCNKRLDSKPQEIECAKAGNSHMIHLVFPDGELNLIANSKTGILNIAWQSAEKPKENTLTWIERYSFGDMKTAVKIGRYVKGENWQDDSVVDDSGKSLVPGSQLGRINGGDGFKDNSDWFYLASSRFCIYRLDKGWRHPLAHSQYFSDEVLDVLTVTVTAATQKHFLLITVHNGAVYLLQDTQNAKLTNDEKAIKIKQWQYTGCPIFRLIGQGDEHILSLDSRGRLIPLRLITNQKVLNDTSDFATDELYGLFKDDLGNYLKMPKDFLVQNEFVLYLGELLLESFLLHWHPNKGINNPDSWQSLSSWCWWLNNYYSTVTTPATVIVQLHTHLIDRLFRWMQKNCFRAYSIETVSFQYDEIKSAWSVIKQLLTPKPDAPAAIWMLLLRKSDWVRCWAKALGLFNIAEFTIDYQHWEQVLWQQRLHLAPGLYCARPFHTLSSHRFYNPPCHIEVIDADKQLIVVLEPNCSLTILQIPPNGETWLELAHLERDKKSGDAIWQGQPMFIKKLASNSPQLIRLLVGSQRGELVVLNWDSTKTNDIVTERNHSYDNFAVMCYAKPYPHTDQHLLGGKTSDNRPCLYLLPTATQLKAAQQLWTGDKLSKGCLRMLQVNDGHTRLWAINSETGELLCWDIQSSDDKYQQLGSHPPKVWLKTVHALNCLGYSAEHNLLICGGQDGLVYALNADTGALRWLVNVAGNLHHLAYLPCETDNDLWQLKGLWLLCSDDKNSLVVNKDGQVIGTLENTNVGCTTIIKQALLVGTLDGRLVLMDTNRPSASPSIESQATSPLSCLTTYSTDQLVEFLQHDDSKETLIATMVLRHCLDYLNRPEAIMPVELSNAFFAYWREQSLERKIVFLYGLRQIFSKTTLSEPVLAFIVSLAERCWQDVATLKESSLLCKFISPLFDILHKLVDSPPHYPEARPLLIKIKSCIWLHKPEELCDENCAQCAVLQKGTALLAIRLNQALKCWHGASGTAAQQVFDWCNAIYVECLADNPAQLQDNLKYLFANNLYLLAKDDPWQLWLAFIFAASEDKAEPPPPLSCLQIPRDGPFGEADLNSLLAIFADNSAWRQWWSNLQTCLGAVQFSRSASSHEAWRERAAWRGLREHIGAQGQETFTVAKGQTLLALWWPYLEREWLGYIDEQLLRLEQQVQNHPDRYLLVATQERWRDARTVEVALKISNRHPYSLNLLKLFWQGHDTQAQHLPKQLSADEYPTELVVVLEATDDNVLDGELMLECVHTESDKAVNFPITITRQRNLLELSADAQWLPTWERLDALLEACNEQNSFHWLSGDTWLQKDRELLEQDIVKKYSVAVDGLPELSPDIHYQEAAASEKSLVSINNLVNPVFSPDIALAAEPHKQLEQFHAVLHNWAGQHGFYWALAVWHWARGSVTASIRQAFAVALPESYMVDNLLTSLFVSAERLEAVVKVLRNLPAVAVGAWCSAEPFYALKDDEAVLANELYLPAACLLSEAVWKCIDDAQVALIDVAELLGITETQALQTQQGRKRFFSVAGLFDSQAQPLQAREMDMAAPLLLGKLGEGSVRYLKPAWQQQTAVTLNWEDFTCLYLLPKTLPSERTELLGYPKGLWLALGETTPLAELNDTHQIDEPKNVCLAITSQQALALLHSQSPKQALVLLNRFAAPQHRINAESAFRTEIGLGSLVEKHFYGRDDELRSLRHCLNEADRELGSGSALLVGGRRMGKTSLRQRMQFELKRDQPRRICLEFNFEGEAHLVELTGVELERWFFEEMSKRFNECGQSFHVAWPKGVKDNIETRTSHRNRLREHLRKLKKDNKCTVLFTFDETEHLIKADANDKKEPFSLFGFFRALIQDKLLCLIATSYPYGAEVAWALNVAKNDSNSPTHNTFSSFIELHAWSPDTAWGFLASRLAGLGVVLPRYYRHEVLDISRGIPWLVHQLGKSICDELAKQYEGDANSNRVVTAEIWQKAKQKALQKLHEVMQESIEKMALRQDTAFQLPFATYPETALSGGNLWRALTTIANNKLYPDLLPGNNWPEPAAFKVQELQRLLPKVKEPALRAALAMLSSSPALEGVSTSREDYVFAGNLLLVWLRHHSGEIL